MGSGDCPSLKLVRSEDPIATLGVDIDIGRFARWPFEPKLNDSKPYLTPDHHG